MARVIQKIYFVERLLQHGYRLELSASGYRARFATISLRGDTRILPTARSVQAMLELPHGGTKICGLAAGRQTWQRGRHCGRS